MTENPAEPAKEENKSDQSKGWFGIIISDKANWYLSVVWWILFIVILIACDLVPLLNARR